MFGFLGFEVKFLGYDHQYNEWLGADRLRSKLIVRKPKPKSTIPERRGLQVRTSVLSWKPFQHAFTVI